MNKENKELLKPVWRVNTGQGVPSDLGDFSMYRDLNILGTSGLDRKIDRVWFTRGNDLDIIAYQTTRTRKAKYERVGCTECEGKGRETVYDIEVHVEYRTRNKCPHCNGKGYTLEAIK